MIVECVVNVSEGRRADVVDTVAAAAGNDLLDVHRDEHHNRSVLTVVGASAPRAVTATAVRVIDLRAHTGVHPRIGAVDVVPFVGFGETGPDETADSGPALAAALAARDRFARWAADTLGLPCFLYGPERTLPEVRRGAFKALVPDTGPAAPHPTAGACAVGARGPLVAYNLWLAEADLAVARRLAAELRGPAVRALGFAVGDGVQVSCNLIAPFAFGPASAYDAVARRATIARAELVGLVPEAVLTAIDTARWEQLDLDPSRTIESRLVQRATRTAAVPDPPGDSQ